jgi:hypothetical protein
MQSMVGSINSPRTRTTYLLQVVVFRQARNYDSCNNATFLHSGLHIHILHRVFVNYVSDISYSASEPKSDDQHAANREVFANTVT